MSASLIVTAGLAVVGLLSNLVWMLVNLRMEQRIGVRIDGLKSWMEDRYVSTAAWDGCRKLCGERHSELCRRIEELESRG